MASDVIEVRPNDLPQTLLDSIAGQGTIEGARVLQWWQRQSADLQRSFADAVRTSVKNGETLAQGATRVVGGTINGVEVPGVMATTMARAATLVATSVNHATNQARLATYQRNTDVVKQIQQISTLDNRTSETCIAYAGKIWDAETLEPVGHNLPFNGGPPRHFNCRSTLVPVTKSFEELGVNADEIGASDRASMDGTVPADVTFDSWLNDQSDVFQNDLLGSAKAEMWRQDEITLTQLVDFKGDPMSVAQLEAMVEARGAASAKAAARAAAALKAGGASEPPVENWTGGGVLSEQLGLAVDEAITESDIVHTTDDPRGIVFNYMSDVQRHVLARALRDVASSTDPVLAGEAADVLRSHFGVNV